MALLTLSMVVEGLNDKEFDDKEWFVVETQKKVRMGDDILD